MLKRIFVAAVVTLGLSVTAFADGAAAVRTSGSSGSGMKSVVTLTKGYKNKMTLSGSSTRKSPGGNKTPQKATNGSFGKKPGK